MNGMPSQLVAFLLCAMSFVSHAQEAPTLDTVTVIGTRGGLPFERAARTVTILGPEQIAAAGAATIAELLETVTSVDIRQRGPDGAQADISIRGGTFEQALVLVDGVPVSDPQTGHHLMDLPITIDDVERIEVLGGQASRAYGPNAVGGVINIVTRVPEGNQVRASVSGGQDRSLAGRVSAGMSAGPVSQRISASRALTDGYRHNSDHDIQNVFYRAVAVFGQARVDAAVGYVDKEFGANGYYSDFFPEQREHTNTVHGTISARVPVGTWQLVPRAYYRRHYDDFVLDSRDPSFYRNETVSHVLGGGLEASRSWKPGVLTVAGEAVWEQLDSDDLGGHDRFRATLHLEHVFSLWGRLTLTPGAALSYVSGAGWGIWPGIDVGLRTFDWLRLTAGVDYSYRVPTFTELYYDSPANRGSEDLDPEACLSTELGLQFSPGPVRGHVSAFRRDGGGVIDWVRAAGQRQWVAGGVDEVDVSGGETAWQVTLKGPLARQPMHMGASYALLDIARTSDRLRAVYEAFVPDSIRPLVQSVPLEFKYGDDYLRHAAVAWIDHSLLLPLRLNWRLRYEQRNGRGDGTWLFDLKAYMNLPRFGFFVSATNLLDQQYCEIGTIPGPGRRCSAGACVLFMDDRRGSGAGSRR